MVDMAWFTGIIVPSEKDMDGMPDIPEGQEAGVDNEKKSPAQKQNQERGAPDGIAEIYDVLTCLFHVPL
jgi:hypothetical protein